MKKYDVLQDLIEGKINEENAEDILSEILHDMNRTVPVKDLLGMSQYEWTAYGNGADFQDIANWRAHGWPNVCFICGQPINVEQFGWLPRRHEGRMQLRHVTCPK
ncbi:hypothetical protein G3N59_16870 [Paraburkholderia sp. Ac-20340]|uniref:hypothetical protein n=1 Tax=Paraburkholderia sp. Ac-20340 TaxID=2703888 RepID=UPI00197FFE93|nr:hypothetical protein [Paraburkholderia sp. Ac-20340]MBN3855057.1 hypothetical protein [Paraburkholderia sp. Ac-20340]